AGLLLGAAGPALGDAVTRSIWPRRRPSGPPVEPSLQAVPMVAVGDVVEQAQLGGLTAFVVADVATGRVLDQVNADQPMPPASVAKTLTALYGLERLGPDHRFVTRVMTVGHLVGGRLDGDLVLVGGGDPTLDSDKLGDLVADLARKGLRQVTGRFLAYAGALPTFERIADDQPVQVGYNPGLSGLGLNFNRVNFEWTKGGARTQMNARGERFVPKVKMARIKVVAREAPLFGFSKGLGTEDWTVAQVGLEQAGSRWLPVRQVAIYTAEVFRTLCAAQGIDLPPPLIVQNMPAGAKALVDWPSDALATILKQMLKFSTNITAETVGLTASGADSLAASASKVQDWARSRLGLAATLVDHSGLGAASRVTASGMVRALMAGDRALGLRPVLRDIGMRDNSGNEIKDSPVKVVGKSGTLNFVSGLVGFITPPGGQDLCFAIFSADVARRQAVPMADRENPPGEDDWVARAHLMQARLINRWVAMA
ncbi:MAG: D-alanyl-D-alanine carboxypeptidase/D-alanyl-D-alanine-endopeptidase, partial [Alphaproteobacteria bacterium]